jgi:hypothetical protein
MKIRTLLMLQFILSLFGCSKAPKSSSTFTELGPFTLETIVKSGKSFNINYGMTDYTNLSYDLTYKGKPLTFDQGLETNTGLPGIWRVFTLKDAPVPALLLGSQTLYLVTLENEKPRIKTVFSQGYDFASIQWLDIEAGQPGDYREIFSSDEFDTETELAGGRYIAVSHAVVLDVRTLEIFPFNTNNEPVDGFNITGSNVIAFSPDSTQLIYRGSKTDEADYQITHWALLSYNFRTGKTYAVPFDKVAFHLADEYKMTVGWVDDYFEWKKEEDGSLKLTTRVHTSPVMRKGILFFQRHQGYEYTLNPVKESMMHHLSDYLQTELKLEGSSISPVTGDYSKQRTIQYQGMTLTLTYGEYGKDLVLRKEGNSLYGENKELFKRIADGFNAILMTGKYQEDWEPVPPPDHY